MKQETKNGTMISRAPWNDAEKTALNMHQHDLTKHSYTCQCGKILYATHGGWICLQDREMRIKQDWAYQKDIDDYIEDDIDIPVGKI